MLKIRHQSTPARRVTRYPPPWACHTTCLARLAKSSKLIATFSRSLQIRASDAHRLQLATT